MHPAATLEAVLESRLEGLTAHERLVVDAAAVIGASFTPAEVGALCPTQEPGVILDVLDALEHKELLAVDADLERFVLRPPHREVAYRRLTKQLRSDLHIHFASLLESAAEFDDQQPDIDARIGRHLDMAYQYQKELHRDLTDSTRELARRAGEHYAAAGHIYCMQLFPDPSTAPHLQRATELLSARVPTGRQARLDLANLLQEEQPELALSLYDAVLHVAGAVQDWSVGQQARLGRMEVTWFHNFQGDWKEGCAEVTGLLDELITPLSRAKALRLLAHAYAAIGRADDAIDAIRRASMIVQETGDRRLEAKVLELACVLLFWGPLHLDDVIEEIQRFVDRAEQQGLYNLQASALSILARATAMLGDFEHARELLQQAKSIRPIRKDLLTIGTDAISEGLVELLAGRLDAAERILHDGYEWLRQQDASVALTSLAAMLGRVHLRRGNQHEAERFVGEAKAAAVETHFDAQIKWRSLQAIIDARRGNHDTAESLALKASALAEQSGQPDTRAEAILDLTEVLRLAGRRQEATEAANKALHIYQNRGSPILAGQVQQLLDDLKTDKTPSA